MSSTPLGLSEWWREITTKYLAYDQQWRAWCSRHSEGVAIDLPMHWSDPTPEPRKPKICAYCGGPEFKSRTCPGCGAPR